MANWRFGKTQYSTNVTVTSGGTLTLVSNSAQYQVLTGSSNHTVVLPDATTTSNGSGIVFSIVNSSTGVITIQLDDAVTTLTTLAANSSVDLFLADHTTTNGTWRVGLYTGEEGGGAGSTPPGSNITSNYSILSSDSGRVLNVDSSSGAITITLPSPVVGFAITIKDLTGSSNINAINIERFGSELINGSSANISLIKSYDAITLISDGTDWFLVGSFIGDAPPASIAFTAGNFSGGNPNDGIEYVNINVLSNATNFGNLTVARFNSSACSSRTLGLIGGGNTGANSNVIDYIEFSAGGLAVDFGDLTVTRTASASFSNNTRGIWSGGTTGAVSDVIDYVTIATTGNAIDFGDLTAGRQEPAGCASPTRGLTGGGSTGAASDIIDYVTIASVGNATDFGDLTVARNSLAAGSNNIRAVFAGGNATNVIDYIMMATIGNATDFGDLPATNNDVSGTGSPNRAIFFGGGASTRIEYIEFATLSNAVDFGDLPYAKERTGVTSTSHGGL